MAMSRWFYLSQVIAQRLTLWCLLGLAIAATLWSVAALVGLVPWLEIPAQFGGRQVDAGAAVQLAGALLLVGLCFFVPMNDRVLRLENSHRVFRVTMRDVAHAYQIAHAAAPTGGKTNQRFPAIDTAVHDRHGFLAGRGAVDDDVIGLHCSGFPKQGHGGSF